MGQVKTQLERNTFVKGLITEASSLAFPENASTAERNFTLSRDGSRQRRLGMDLEPNSTWLDAGVGPSLFPTVKYQTYRWTNVGGDPTRTIIVVRTSDKVWFHEGGTTTVSTATRRESPLPASVTNGLYDLKFSSIEGYLVVVGRGDVRPYLVEPSGSSFVATPLILEIRDLWGVDDSIGNQTRPATLSDEHKYNLLNQGWPSNRITATYGSGSNLYPSNADVPWIARKDDGTWDESLLNDYGFGNASSPKGKFIINAFNRGDSRRIVSGNILATWPQDQIVGKFTTVEAFAGRLFYSGFWTDNIIGEESTALRYAETVFFSQVGKSREDYAKCYQEADPTAQDSIGLLDTDGGFIRITGSGFIYDLIAIGASLIVMAENGVWSISGPDGVFTPLSYSITKVSDTGPLNRKSTLQTEQGLVIWSQTGIYLLEADGVTGRLSPRHLTAQTIQTFYQDIPEAAKNTCVGFYDKAGRTLRWLYHDPAVYVGEEFNAVKNREIVFDLVLGAWYVYDLATTSNGASTAVLDYIDVGEISFSTEALDVITGADEVLAGSNKVVVEYDIPSNQPVSVKYLCLQDDGTRNPNYGVGYYRNTAFKDWGTEDAAAYLETGQELFGDTQRGKQANYLTLHFERTEDGFEEVGDDLLATNPSGCLVQAKWDFADNTSSGKIGRAFQGYRLKRNYIPAGAGEAFDYGWEIITTKNKLRGSGTALKLRFDTEEGKACVLLGWAVDVGGRSNV
jgi:hypothetical protein